jgi:putative Holliday junction resolvase
MSAAPHTILAFDYGQRRIGLAVGQSITRTANPLLTLSNRDNGPDWPQIGELLRQWQPSLLLVGLPLHSDGQISEISRQAEQFAAELQRRFGIRVEMHNEHLTSAEAQTQLRAQRASGQRRRKINKQDIDAAAAALILESWFQQNNG